MTTKDEKLFTILDKIIKDIDESREQVRYYNKSLSIFGKEKVEIELVNARRCIERIKRDLL